MDLRHSLNSEGILGFSTSYQNEPGKAISLPGRQFPTSAKWGQEYLPYRTRLQISDKVCQVPNIVAVI